MNWMARHKSSDNELQIKEYMDQTFKHRIYITSRDKLSPTQISSYFKVFRLLFMWCLRH